MPVSTATASLSCPSVPANHAPAAPRQISHTTKRPSPSSSTSRPRLTSERMPCSGALPAASRSRKWFRIRRTIASAVTAAAAIRPSRSRKANGPLPPLCRASSRPGSNARRRPTSGKATMTRPAWCRKIANSSGRSANSDLGRSRFWRCRGGSLAGFRRRSGRWNSLGLQAFGDRLADRVDQRIELLLRHAGGKVGRRLGMAHGGAGERQHQREQEGTKRCHVCDRLDDAPGHPAITANKDGCRSGNLQLLDHLLGVGRAR